MVQSCVETGDEIHKKVDFLPVLSVSINGSTILLVTLNKKERVTFDDPFLLNQPANPLTPFQWANISQHLLPSLCFYCLSWEPPALPSVL